MPPLPLVLLDGRRRGRPGVRESLNVDRAEAVTPALPGAARWPAPAFRAAVFSYVLRWWCTEREAIDAVWAEGDWRERTAADAAAPLDRADRLTGEGCCGRWTTHNWPEGWHEAIRRRAVERG